VRRELFVILRPQIVDSDEAGRAVQQAFREKFEVLKEVLDELWY
jgi:type II secretory pathway component GspD/PulD (secretin)